MELKRYTVRSGAVLAHHGEELVGGTVVELPPHVALDVRHLVVPIDPVTGAEQPWSAPTQAAVEADIARFRPHEQVTLLDERIAAVQADLASLERLRADAATKVQAAAPATAPAPALTTQAAVEAIEAPADATAHDAEAAPRRPRKS